MTEVTSGIIAALSAPLFEAVGFLEFERHWRDGRGSAFSLNLFKCNVSAIGFLFVVWLQRMGPSQPGPSPFNALYLEHEPPNVYGGTGKQLRSLQEALRRTQQEFVPLVVDLRQQQNPRGQDTQTYAYPQQPQSESPQLVEQSEQSYPIANDEIMQKLPVQDGSQSSPNEHQEPFNHFIANQPQHFQDQSQSRQPLNSAQKLPIQGGVQSSQHEPQEPFNQFIPQQKFEGHLPHHDVSQPFQPFHSEQGYDQQKSSVYYPNLSTTEWSQFSTQQYGDTFTVVTVSHLMLSSLLGIFIGDCCELEALRLIGARRVLLMASMKPFAAAFFAHWFLQEDLHVPAWFGMALTMMGVLLVVQQSMESISKSKKLDNDSRMKHTRQPVRRTLFGASSKKSNIGARPRDVSFTSDASDDVNGEIDGVGFSTIWETNGFSYISNKPVRHKSLSKFDALYEVSSDEESTDSLINDEEMYGFDDDDFFNDVPLVELAHILPLQSNRMRSISATSGGSWGSMKKFVEVEDPAQDESNSQWYLDPVEKKNALSGVSRKYFNSDLDSPTRPANRVEQSANEIASSISETPYTESLFLSVQEIAQEDIGDFECGEQSDQVANQMKSSETMESLFLSAEEIAQEDIRDFDCGEQSEEEATYEKILKERKESLRSTSSGSLKSLKSEKSECGPPPGSQRENSIDRLKRIRQGYLLALCNVCLDSYGFLLTKQYGINMTTWEINSIRYGFAGFILLLVSFVLRTRDVFCGGAVSKRNLGVVHERNKMIKVPSQIIRSSHAQGHGISSNIVPAPSWYRLPNLSTYSWIVMLVGVLFVSFLCPALQGYALFRLAFSLAITLSSVTPLYALPLMWLLKNQKPSKRGCWGAVIAVSGLVVLCIWGYDWS